MELRDESTCEFWQDLSYYKKVQKLLNEGYLADCKFIVGPPNEEVEVILGHKLMFILESPVCEKLFTGSFLEGEVMPEVRIEDYYPEDFKNFCFLIYYHNAKENKELFKDFSIVEIVEICRICHKYMVTSLLNKCLEYIKSILSNTKLKNHILLYELAYEINEKRLITSIEEAIVSKNVFFDKQLNVLPPEIFYNYISFLSNTRSYCGVPSTGQMFAAIDTYFTVNNLIDKRNKKTLSENKEEQVDNKEEKADNKDSFSSINKFLNFIDFNNMTAKEFALGPGKTELLDLNVKYYILSELAKK